MMDGKGILQHIRTYKYPILVLLIGVLLLSLPTSGTKKEPNILPETALEQALSVSRGVGRVRILLSENGAVVVCDGAENAGVRLDILRAIGSYTGFGSDRITVLKMSD